MPSSHGTPLRSPHPWPWLAAGALVSVAASVTHLAEGPVVAASLLLVLGLALTGISAAIRLQAASPTDFATVPSLKGLARLLLTIFLVGFVAAFRAWMLYAAAARSSIQFKIRSA